MPLPSDEESKGGSYTEIDEIHGNQLQFREEEDETKSKTAIELVENTDKSFEKEVDKRNEKEGPGGFLGDQLQSREEDDETKTAIELVENTSKTLGKSFEEEVGKRTDKEGPEYKGLHGESEAQSCGEDVVHDGININALYRELTLKKMWHERTWIEILKHFAITLIISVLPTFFDVGTDINAVLKYWNEGNPIWSFTTLFLIFFPGLFFSIWVRKASSKLLQVLLVPPFLTNWLHTLPVRPDCSEDCRPLQPRTRVEPTHGEDDKL